MAKTETRKMLAAAAAAAEAKQAVDLRVLELDQAESSLTDFFLILGGANARQIQTLADAIELRLKLEFNELPHSREGYREAEWVLLDYVDFVVHIMSAERRAYYGLERLRKSARLVSAAELARWASGKTASKKAVSRKAAGKKSSARSSATRAPSAAKSKSRKPTSSTRRKR